MPHWHSLGVLKSLHERVFGWTEIHTMEQSQYTMRIDVHFTDRVGIAQEILAALASRALNVSAVEVEPPHIYIEAPALGAQDLAALREPLMRVSGVLSVAELEMLPGARRRLYLDALMASLTDPVLAVDGRGVVVLANAAAVAVCGMPEAELAGRSLARTDRRPGPGRRAGGAGRAPAGERGADRRASLPDGDGGSARRGWPRGGRRADAARAAAPGRAHQCAAEPRCRWLRRHPRPVAGDPRAQTACRCAWRRSTRRC